MRHVGSKCLLMLAILVLVTQPGCAPYRAKPATEAARQEAVIRPPRSSRGNPPYYEVLGQRYYVLDSSVGYRETGVASWYGQKFQGLPTSSGETYNMHAMTAAHTTLPIPTWVEVTHLGNGRRVIVRVNDRGPFLHGRLIDLSYGAAQALGMASEGTARVEVRALGAPAVGTPPAQDATIYGASEQPSGGFSIISEAAAATPGAEDRPMRQLYLQVGAFTQHGNAAQLVGALEAAGYKGVFIDSDAARSPPMHRVRIGPFAQADAVDAAVEGLGALGVEETHLVVEP